MPGVQTRIISPLCVLVAQSCLTLWTPWTVACQAPLSMGFSRQEYWNGVPLPSLTYMCMYWQFYTQESKEATFEHKVKVKMKSLTHVQLATPWAIAYQAPPSMEFSSQEYCSGLPFPSPGDLPDPGIEPWSPALQADALLSEPPGKPRQYIKKQKHHFADKVKAMVFPVVKYGCEKWTIKKGEQRRLDVFKL